MFISKSGQFQNTSQWIDVFTTSFDKRFNFISDDEFRLIAGMGLFDHWFLQFRYTRASFAMLVLMDPEEWTSRGQDIEIEDVMGRGMPIALCRTQSFSNVKLNERFRSLMASSVYPHAPFSCVGCFDFFECDMNAEVRRLATWVDRFATPPQKLPDQLTAGQATIFQANIRIPFGRDWRFVEWRTYHPILGFNYGHLLLQLGTSIRRRCKDEQVVVPLTPTGIPGEVRAHVTLDSVGFGHAVLTIGEPSTDYTYDDGGLVSNSKDEVLLWWDFNVQAPT